MIFAIVYRQIKRTAVHILYAVIKRLAFHALGGLAVMAENTEFDSGKKFALFRHLANLSVI